jgi:hypothetical protein
LDAGQDSPVVNVVRFGFGNDGGESPQIGQQEKQQKLELFSKKHQFEGKEGGGEREELAVAAAPNQEVIVPTEQQTTEFGNNPVAANAGVDSGAPEPVDLSALPGEIFLY